MRAAIRFLTPLFCALLRLSGPADNVAMTEAPRRNLRWFRFSLRSLMILVTLFCVVVGGYVLSQKQIVRERAAMMTFHIISHAPVDFYPTGWVNLDTSQSTGIPLLDDGSEITNSPKSNSMNLHRKKSWKSIGRCSPKPRLKKSRDSWAMRGSRNNDSRPDSRPL